MVEYWQSGDEDEGGVTKEVYSGVQDVTLEGLHVMKELGQRSYDIFGWVLFFSFGGPSHQDNHRDLVSKRFPALGVALAQESLWQLSTRALTTPIRTCAIPCG